MKPKYLIQMLIGFISLGVIFASCSKDDDNPTTVESVSRDTRLVGQWTLTKVTIPSMSMELTPAQAGFMITGTVNSDGTFQMNTTDSTGTLQENGTWSTSGTVITMSYTDSTARTMEYTVNNNIVTVATPVELQPGVEVPSILEFLKS